MSTGSNIAARIIHAGLATRPHLDVWLHAAHRVLRDDGLCHTIYPRLSALIERSGEVIYPLSCSAVPHSMQLTGVVYSGHLPEVTTRIAGGELIGEVRSSMQGLVDITHQVNQEAQLARLVQIRTLFIVHCAVPGSDCPRILIGGWHGRRGASPTWRDDRDVDEVPVSFLWGAK